MEKHTIKGEYKAGFANGLLHETPITGVLDETSTRLYAENIIKANAAIKNDNEPLVKAYWQGYLDGIKSLEKSA